MMKMSRSEEQSHWSHFHTSPITRDASPVYVGAGQAEEPERSDVIAANLGAGVRCEV